MNILRDSSFPDETDSIHKHKHHGRCGFHSTRIQALHRNDNVYDVRKARERRTQYNESKMIDADSLHSIHII